METDVSEIKKNDSTIVDFDIKRHGFIGEGEESDTKIVFTLFRSKKPMTNKEICDETGFERAWVSKRIKSLMERGIVLPLENGKSGRRYYTLQLFMIDDEIFNELLEDVKKLAVKIGKTLILEHTDNSFEQALKSNTVSFIDMITVSIKD